MTMKVAGVSTPAITLGVGDRIARHGLHVAGHTTGEELHIRGGPQNAEYG
jgi:hypothetical protein